MVPKYPQNTPSPGTPIGISQFGVAVRAITSKRSTWMKTLFWAIATAFLLKFGLRCQNLIIEFILTPKSKLQFQYRQVSNFNIEVEDLRWKWTPKLRLRSYSTLLFSIKISTQPNVFIRVDIGLVEKISTGVPPDWRTAACNDHGV